MVTLYTYYTDKKGRWLFFTDYTDKTRKMVVKDFDRSSIGFFI